MMKQSQITYWCHEIIRSQARTGGLYIDATMGKGNDTLMLCELAGEAGEVFAFDIQEDDLAETRARFKKKGIENAKLILDSHSNIDCYSIEKPKAVLFNLGYLPGGDHTIQTKYGTTIEAIEKSLEILRANGEDAYIIGEIIESEDKIIL